jgi:hypothetical protein
MPVRSRRVPNPFRDFSTGAHFFQRRQTRVVGRNSAGVCSFFESPGKTARIRTRPRLSSDKGKVDSSVKSPFWRTRRHPAHCRERICRSGFRRIRLFTNESKFVQAAPQAKRTGRSTPKSVRAVPTPRPLGAGKSGVNRRKSTIGRILSKSQGKQPKASSFRRLARRVSILLAHSTTATGLNNPAQGNALRSPMKNFQP